MRVLRNGASRKETTVTGDKFLGAFFPPQELGISEASKGLANTS